MPQTPSLSASWPAEAETRWITEHKDDPEEDSPQSDNETAEELGQFMTQKAEVSAVMAKLNARTDEYNTEVVTQAQ